MGVTCVAWLIIFTLRGVWKADPASRGSGGGAASKVAHFFAKGRKVPTASKPFMVMNGLACQGCGAKGLAFQRGLFAKGSPFRNGPTTKRQPTLELQNAYNARKMKESKKVQIIDFSLISNGFSMVLIDFSIGGGKH